MGHKVPNDTFGKSSPNSKYALQFIPYSVVFKLLSAVYVSDVQVTVYRDKSL